MKRYIRSATTSNVKLAIDSKDPKVLAQLANDGDESVRWHVARNQNTPVNVLAQLANDKDEWVRGAVAGNPNTSIDILAQLTSDEYWVVRQNVVDNPNTPVDILVQLANDADNAVRVHVADNPNTPADVIIQFANDESSVVRRRVASNLNTPAEILAQLANDEDEDVRKTAIDNPNCPVKPKKSKKSNNWPSADAWYNIESDEEFEDMWSRYLAGPEDEVNKLLKIFPEPSIQGGFGSMVIFDESGDENESVDIDYQDWCDNQLNMAAESKNATEYRQKYKAFVEDLIAENWK